MKIIFNSFIKKLKNFTAFYLLLIFRELLCFLQLKIINFRASERGYYMAYFQSVNKASTVFFC